MEFGQPIRLLSRYQPNFVLGAHRMDLDPDRQTKYGAKKPSPTLARATLTQLRVRVAGEPAGVWENFVGSVTQLANLADALVVGARTTHGTVARLSEEQFVEWRQLAKGIRGSKMISAQVIEPASHDRGE